MADPFSDRYWIEEFRVTEADLNRIESQMRETGQAYDLTGLARRLVRGRLRYGPETSTPARTGWSVGSSVRLWDPANSWAAGDHAIVAALQFGAGEKWYEPFVGEVVEAGAKKVTIHIDALGESRTYWTRAQYGPDDLEKWRRKVEDIVAKKREAKDVPSQIEYVILEHGERVATQLLQALKADEHFVRLAGRWFLREQAVPATDEQLASLAWAMLVLEEPKSTADLVSLIEPPLTEGDPNLYGLYLSMRGSGLFKNADPGKRPRWVLAGAPPGTCTPHHAAYDPETYEVLCLPGEQISPKVVEQLWRTDLLRAVAATS
jgi:hypothetical protein